MWLKRDNSTRKEGVNGLVGVAIDKDKGSQYALKWAIDNILNRGQTVVLIHVKASKHPSSYSSSSSTSGSSRPLDAQLKDLFLPYRCFCTRKDIQCKDVILEETDVAKALIDFATQSAIEILVLGSSSRGSFLRFNKVDTPTVVMKGAPDFCTIYIIAKGKIASTKSATRPAPPTSALRSEIMKSQSQSIQATSCNNTRGDKTVGLGPVDPTKTPPLTPPRTSTEMDFRSPFTRGERYPHVKSYGELLADSDISFVSSGGRASVDSMFPSFYDNADPSRVSTGRLSIGSDISDNPFYSSRRKSVDVISTSDFSQSSCDDSSSISPPRRGDDMEAEMRRLKLELKQTMDMYSNACKEALTAKQKAMELQKWKLEEERRLEEARVAEEAARALVHKEKAKSKAAVEAAEAAQRIAELEAQKRVSSEMKALKELEDRKRLVGGERYRRYTIEEIEVATEYFTMSRKIGEGGYGPVFKAYLDHTPVAIKVLRPDAAQGRAQFQQEVEVLSCIRHPNMVLLLGACPEYGCLVYEYLQNGSLEDRLFCKGGTPPLPWQLRFCIAAEIATGLLFLHQSKPEPLVHRDLKPANILLDRNFVSKISDVGLARLVPSSVADSVTQYRMTSAAGTFCYIDPEYQQTGMLGVKSDVYSLGVMLLQIITAKPPMGLTHYVQRAIESGTLKDMLDPAVPDWPVEEALNFAKLAIKCSELRRKDRPDLGSVVLPELNRLRMLGEGSEKDAQGFSGGIARLKRSVNHISVQQEVVSSPTAPHFDTCSGG